jgi:hypothetical protein
MYSYEIDTPNPIDPDSYERIILCIRVLTDPNPLTRFFFLDEFAMIFK